MAISKPIKSFFWVWKSSFPPSEQTRLEGRLEGSRSTAPIEKQRIYKTFDWLTRVMVPEWLDRAGLPAPASRLRAAPELQNPAACQTAKTQIEDAGNPTKIAALRAKSHRIVCDQVVAVSARAARAAIWDEGSNEGALWDPAVPYMHGAWCEAVEDGGNPRTVWETIWNARDATLVAVVPSAIALCDTMFDM